MLVTSEEEKIASLWKIQQFCVRDWFQTDFRSTWWWFKRQGVRVCSSHGKLFGTSCAKIPWQRRASTHHITSYSTVNINFKIERHCSAGRWGLERGDQTSVISPQRIRREGRTQASRKEVTEKKLWRLKWQLNDHKYLRFQTYWFGYHKGRRVECSMRTLRPGTSLLPVHGLFFAVTYCYCLGEEGLNEPNFLGIFTSYSIQPFSYMSSPMVKRTKLFLDSIHSLRATENLQWWITLSKREHN